MKRNKRHKKEEDEERKQKGQHEMENLKWQTKTKGYHQDKIDSYHLYSHP